MHNKTIIQTHYSPASHDIKPVVITGLVVALFLLFFSFFQYGLSIFLTLLFSVLLIFGFMAIISTAIQWIANKFYSEKKGGENI
jgi:hypothetical protein